MNKAYFKIDCVERFHDYKGLTKTKWELIKEFISFLRNPQKLQLQITKINKVIISQNQTWKYDKLEEDYILKTDLRGKINYDLWHKDKYIE